MTHIEALDLDVLPAHLIVIGGGYAGLELAQAYRRFGAEVTVVEASPQLMAREDADASHEIRRILTNEGVQIHVPAELLKVSGQSGNAVSVGLRTSAGERTIEGSHILVAAGRVPNTAGIGLDKAGVELTDRGYVKVNERLETSAPDVWALGDCAGSPLFTHISEDDFRIVRDNLAGGRRSTRDRFVPYCMFTDPPLAHVGLSEREAERHGRQDARREAADEGRAAGAGDRRNRRLHEGSRRRERRPHSRLHHDRRAGRRSDGGCAHGDDGGLAIHETSRGRFHASDLRRGTGLPVREHTGANSMSAEIEHLAWVAGKAGLLYATAIIGLRLGKRRILTELSPFDFVAAVAVGAIVGRIPSASDADYLAGAVTLIAVLFAHAVVSHLRQYSSVARLVDQSPRILVANGEILEDGLRRSGLCRADVESLLRQRGVHNVGEVEYLILEEGGKVSIVADGARAPPSEPDLFSDVTRSQTRGPASTITALT